MGATDCNHEPLRLAIAAQGPGSRSKNLPVCVDSDAVTDCSVHVVTPKNGLVNTDPASPADYNSAVMAWDPRPARRRVALRRAGAAPIRCRIGSMVTSSSVVSVDVDRERALAYRLRALDLDGPSGRRVHRRPDRARDPRHRRAGHAAGVGPALARLATGRRARPVRGRPGAGWCGRRGALRTSTGRPTCPASPTRSGRSANGTVVNRLISGGKALASSDIAPLDGFAIAVAGMAEVVTGPMTKPEASAALTEHLPDELSGFCEPCGSVHVYEMVFRNAALPAGIGLVAGARPLTLAPITGWPGSSPDRGATADLLSAFLAVARTSRRRRGRRVPRVDPSRGRGRRGVAGRADRGHGRRPSGLVPRGRARRAAGHRSGRPGEPRPARRPW